MDMTDMTGFDAQLDANEVFPTGGRTWHGLLQFLAQIGRRGPVKKEGNCETFQFVTLYTHAQQPLLASSLAKHLLLAKISEAKAKFHLDIAGYVVLDDHIHFLYVTQHSQKVAPVVDLLREGFARDWRRLQCRETKPSSGIDQPIWKSEIKSYRLTLADELRTHLNFIHYDPVRHGLVERAADYAWSSLPARIHQGHYPGDWAVQAPPAGVAKVARALYLST